MVRLEHSPAPKQVHRVSDRASGLLAYVVLDDTTLGPAFGGIRCARYASESEARADAEGLAAQMTLKCALAGLPAGGGKGVVIQDRLKDRRAAFAALGDFVESLGGRFRTAGDLGTGPEDLRAMASRSSFVAREEDLGDLGDATAIGVVAAIRVIAARLGADSLRGLRVAVQGLGAIGMPVARRLANAGANVLATDLVEERVRLAERQHGVGAVDARDILEVEADVFCPCARGGVIDRERARRIPQRAIAGGANRVLADESAGSILFWRGIAYAPDFAVNAGAVIRGARFMLEGSLDTDREIEAIGPRIGSILDEAERTGIEPERVAAARARARIAAVR